jgi:hypothetical protein
MTWFLLVLFAVVLLVILAALIRLGIAALGTPGDRAAASETCGPRPDFSAGGSGTGANTRGTAAPPNTGPSRATWAIWGMK